MNRFFQTDDSIQSLVLRLAVGGLFLPHGLQKLGFLGGYGIEGTLGFFGSIGIPTPIGVLVILAETVGAVALIAGATTRLWAAVLAATMIGAMAVAHVPAGDNVEYNLALLAMTGLLTVFGGGRWSVDGWIASRATSEPVAAALHKAA